MTTTKAFYAEVRAVIALICAIAVPGFGTLLSTYTR